MHKTIATGAALPVLTAMAREVSMDSDLLLQTKHTTMAFRRSNDTWEMAYYGSRIEKASDVSTLAWSGWSGENTLGYPQPASYSVYGSDSDRGGMNKFGGLAVNHADGVTSTDLRATGSRRVDDEPGVTHIVFELQDRVYPFFVVQHFRAVEGSDVVETWVEFRHDEPEPVKLVRMDSVALIFPLLAKEYSLLSLTGQWASEAQVAEAPIAQGQKVSLTSRSGVRSAFGNNPSFMLSVGPKASETAGRVIGGSLAWSGAWEISVQRDHVNTLMLNAGADTGNGPYTLDPRKTLTAPKMALTYSASGKGQISRNLHRWARDRQLRHGHLLRPVLLNSWEGAFFNFNEKTLTGMMDGVQELGGEMFVVDDGWFGKGKYARNDEKRGLGDWVLNDAKLPRGLGWLASEAAARHLKLGIWIEPEMANTASELVDQHPEWVLREKTRPLRQGRGGTQVVLDMTNPALRDNIYGQIDALITSIPGLAYIKWDANADFMNAGSTYLGADRQANLWFDYTAGLYELLGRLRSKYPDIIMQACSSGGGHMDFGFLHYADEFWTSDNTDAWQRVFIQWGAGYFYPACAMAAHVTAVPNHQTHRSTPLKFRFDVAMSGRLGFELDPKNMVPEEIAFAKKAVADYMRLRPVIQQGDLYRLVSPWENTYAALMYVSDDQSRAAVFVYGLSRFILTDYLTPLSLQGLDPNKRYCVTEVNRDKREHSRVSGKTLAGSALLEMGLPIKLDGDYDSAIFELVEDKDEAVPPQERHQEATSRPSGSQTASDVIGQCNELTIRASPMSSPQTPMAGGVEPAPRAAGYRGIWFTLGHFSEYGDKYSGGLGTYTSSHNPLAVYAPAVEKTFFVYGGSPAGECRLLCMIGTFDHRTGRVERPVIVVDKLNVDDPHDNPSINLDRDGFVWVFISGRAQLRPGFVYRSTAPYDISRFELIAEKTFTYPQPWYHPSQGFLHLFSRYKKGRSPSYWERELYWEASVDGRTWRETRKLAGFGGHYQTSGAHDSKVATFFNYHPDGDNDKRTNLYYVQTTDWGRSWTTVDGKQLNLPLAEIQNPALVRDYASSGQLLYTCDLNFDALGNPILLYVLSRDHRPGPQGGAREWTIAHWTDEDWRFSTIATSNHNYDMGSLYVLPDGEWRVIAPTDPGPQVWGAGGEMALWSSQNGGKTWNRIRSVTSNSPLNHNYSRRPLNARDPFYAFWADGNPSHLSKSNLYFCDSTGEHVWRLPYTMPTDSAAPEPVQ